MLLWDHALLDDVRIVPRFPCGIEVVLSPELGGERASCCLHPDEQHVYILVRGERTGKGTNEILLAYQPYSLLERAYTDALPE